MRAIARDMEVALAAAAAGVSVVRSAYGAEPTRHTKAGGGFSTDADLNAERAILEVIEAARPGDSWVGEETGKAGGSDSRRWLVDPLCGTLNFAAQTPLVAVNVALVAGASTLACVSADPIAGEYFCFDGHHSFLRRGGSDQALHPSAVSRLVDINCDGPVDRPFLGPQLIADPALRAEFDPRVLSTTLAVAWVAAGRRAAYISDGFFADNLHFAAGIAVCRGAGCVITDLAGEPLNTGRGLIVAADTETHACLLEIIQPHLAQVLREGTPASAASP